MTTLTFQNTTISVINQNNQIWLTTLEVGKALGYSNPLKAIATLFDRHQDEFTPNMTALVDMQTAGGMQKVRIFSLRGCHLIAMLSHTKVAKDFRRWVLDILDQEASQNAARNLALESLPKITDRFVFERYIEDELQGAACFFVRELIRDRFDESQEQIAINLLENAIQPLLLERFKRFKQMKGGEGYGKEIPEHQLWDAMELLGRMKEQARFYAKTFRKLHDDYKKAQKKYYTNTLRTIYAFCAQPFETLKDSDLDKMHKEIEIIHQSCKMLLDSAN